MATPATALASAQALLTAAEEPLELPPMPGPDEGLHALWTWLWTVNDQLSIPDPEFRWMFGGFTLSMLLLFELVGVRKDWKLYPFLLPFWLVFGSVGLGVVGGVAATLAHIVLFPLGRLYFIARDRRRRRDGDVPAPATAPAATPPPTPAPPEALRAAMERMREVMARRMGAGRPGATPNAPVPSLVQILRAFGEVVAQSQSGSRPTPRSPPPPLPPRPPPAHGSEATGAAPEKPDLAAFRPDLSRFRRRPPRG